MPNIDQIKYYVETASCLSFRKAAEHLYITQPTLSRQMRSLEEEYNLQLFLRSKKGLKLTPAGTVLYEEFKKLLTQYQESVGKAKQAGEGYSDALYIGLVSGMFIDELIAESIRYFQKTHPNIRLSFSRCLIQELMAEMQLEKLDAIIAFDHQLQGWQERQRVESIPCRPAWLIPKCNPLSQKEKIYFKDMASQELLLTSEPGYQPGRDYIIECCKKYGGFYPNIFYVRNIENILMWLNISDKCAFLNSRIPITDQVKQFPVEEFIQQDSYIECAWTPQNKKYSLSLFLDYLSKIKAES